MADFLVLLGLGDALEAGLEPFDELPLPALLFVFFPAELPLLKLKSRMIFKKSDLSQNYNLIQICNDTPSINVFSFYLSVDELDAPLAFFFAGVCTLTVSLAARPLFLSASFA